MSYSFTTPPLTKDRDPADAILNAFETPTNPGGKSPADYQADAGTLVEARHGVNAAAEAARVLVGIGPRSGQGGLGENVDTYTVHVSGHANPNHEAKAGWGNDFVQVSVHVQRYAGATETTPNP